MKILPKNISPDPYLGKGTEFIRFFTFIAIVVILSISTFMWLTADDVSTMGNIGSFLGGILGPLFALLVGVFTFLAFYVQYDANKKIQEQFRVQQFENKFYKMLDLHKANVSEMKIAFYDHKLTGAIDEFKGVNSEEFLREVEGRKLFVGMVAELEACFEIVNYRCKEMNIKLDTDLFKEYCYKLFFYGIRSEQIILQDIPTSLHDSVIEYLHINQQAFYDRNKNHSKKKSESDHHFRFYPFEGHESRLGHYYRHMFEMVRLVVGNDKLNKEEGLFEHEEARQYLKMLRAQLSNSEQLMLYYNYICGFGKEWDQLGKRKNKFLTEYRMIHNIPVDRVLEYVENPRDHFKDFICEKCSEDDPLFEWGDERKALGCT